MWDLLYRVPPLAGIRRAAERPADTQRALLRRLLTRAQATEWGRRYGFADILRAPDVVAAYQARVPLHTYDDYRADVHRVRSGTPDVIWPGTFRHFAVSSGTASAGKIIPVSPETLAANRDFSLAAGLNYLAASRNPRYLLGKHLTLPGRIEDDPQYPGTLVGEVSGLQAEHAPAFFQRLYQAVPNEVSFMPNWERKLKAIADRAMGQDVRLIVMAPTWGLVFFKELVRRYNEVRGARAQTVGEVWPNLQVMMTGGVALSSYRDLLEAEIGLDGLDFIETYGASEGFIAFQDTLDDPSMLLYLGGAVFFEFVPMERLGDPDAPRLTIADVALDERYALHMTTASGLWSYPVGDVVRFTSLRPPRIVVAGRTGEMLDTYGEAVFGEEARDAIEQASAATGAAVRDYHVSPRPATADRLPAHQWLVEFEAAPDDLSAFARRIDEHLQTANRHYQIRREAGAFDGPDVVALPAGAFYRWLKEVKGTVSGQTKVPRMREDRTVADAVLAGAGEGAGGA